jgi:tetratricopeptide (TPR) repeat protein
MSRLAMAAVLALAVLGGCAHALPAARPGGAGADSEGERGWRALVDGNVPRARAIFDARLGLAPRDLWASFGSATMAYGRGDDPTALDRYTAVLEAVAAGEPAGQALAVVAAVRVTELLDEASDDALAGARVEQRVLALSHDHFSWESRVELARLGDRIARRRGDAALLDQQARAAGCAREVFQIGSAGRLPHLDLEAPLPATATAARGPESWRPLLTPGCRVSVPPWNGRPGVQVLKTAVAVSAGRYSVVLDFSGEARIRVDGGAFLRHGDESRYGPRVSRNRVALPAGRHEIEVRVGVSAGRSELALWIFDDSSETDIGAEAVTPPRAATAGGGLDAAAEYARAFVAQRLGETDRTLALGDALARRKAFAAGLALAAEIAHGDATRPVGFARDAARALLRAAVERDPGAARAWHTLAELELDAEHPRDAIENAQRAARAAPRWWVPEIMLVGALRSRGLEWDADRALDRAADKGGPVVGAPCSVVTALLRRAEERRDLVSQPALVDRLGRCDGDAGVPVDRLRARGDLEGALKLLRQRVALDPDREDLRTDLASVLLAKGDFAAARAELGRLVSEEPTDASLRVRLADAEAAAGDLTAAQRTLTAALARRPDLSDVRRAARALGLALPLEDSRIDGAQVIQSFRASGRRYAAPAVMVLDRTVHRVFPDGAELILTHNIVAVQTKDGIEKWGEVTVPSGGEILMLRTHKHDGSTREPEEIAGKDTVSAPDLAAGDCVEWETLESKPASDAFSPGFLGERFYFQSFDAPLDRSEYILVTPKGLALDVDGRAGAPAASVAVRDAAAGDGAGGALRITTFAAHEVPQLFAERSSVPAIEYVPSVRVSSQVSWQGWARFLAEQLYGTARSSPPVRALAAEIAKAAAAAAPPRGTATAATQAANAAAQAANAAAQAANAAAIVRWVTNNVEAGDDLRDPASFTLARGRGNRLALVLALARELRVPATAQLARSRLVAEVDGALVPQEVDDFGDTIVRFAIGAAAPVYVDLRLRHAAFGYLPPSLDGAKTLSVDGGRFGVARSGGAPDQRTVDMTIHLDERGGGKALATEELTGWPALEWAELMDRFGSDKIKMRQDFEQRWLGVQFPGARLDDLQVELVPLPAEGRVRVRYSFVSPQLGVRSDQEIKLSPTFFRSQPGRRFATEPRRSTTLMLGFDVPVRMTATVVLPSAARVIEPATPPAGVIARKGAYRFLEERTSPPGSPEVLLLHRESALPLTRVSPAEYAGVAADLRRVDGLEQQEIRIRLHGAQGQGQQGQSQIIGRSAGAR